MELFMDNIIHDNSTKRRINILKILNNKEGFVSTHFLANQLGCSSRTILNDIIQLKSEIPPNWGLLAIKSKGYMLKKPASENFDSIVQVYLKDSVLYHLLLGIFNGKYFTIEKWSQLLYINKITLKNLIKKFNNFIANCGLKLRVKSQTLKLVGNEINIRYFYIAFFYLILKYNEEIPLFSIVKEGMNKIIQYHEVKINPNLLLSILMVSIKRNFLYKFIKEKIENTIFLDDDQINCFEEIVSLIEEYYKIKFQLTEKSLIKLYFFLASNNTFTQKNALFNEITKNNMTYNTLLDHIKEKNNLSSPMVNKLTMEIGIDFYKLNIMKKLNFPIQYFENTIELVSNTYYQLYRKNYACIYSWNKKYRKLTNRFELQYVTALISMFLYTNPEKINILLLFSGTILEENLIFLKLKQNLKENIIIHRDFNPTIQYDLIVTNKQVLDVDIPIIYIFQNGSEKEIDFIKSKVM
ncbi:MULTISPECIES: helix-turn-helix domain-containing protein [Bacillus cereus group]|uniref:helix-turn-helix domain-containing protein n=1 Tax=Bacillus cereus group TaxID=86661 RepID=UPI000279EAB2|nr:helix-turn-helix domain-containing protein [Bacillus cereus]EJR28448.1 hypothetical protein IIE_05287 [Bacillus cereus VD045]